MTQLTTIDRTLVEQIVRQIVTGQTEPVADTGSPAELVVSISARHCHLSDEHVETLFGAGHQLTPMRGLTKAASMGLKRPCWSWARGDGCWSR